MTEKEIFQKNLSYFLETTGKTHRELAEFCNVKRNTVTGWVHGASYPRAKVMYKIAEFFHAKPSDIFEDKQHQETEIRLLNAWRNADPTYKAVALELLESHQIGG